MSMVAAMAAAFLVFPRQCSGPRFRKPLQAATGKFESMAPAIIAIIRMAPRPSYDHNMPAPCLNADTIRLVRQCKSSSNFGIYQYQNSKLEIH